MAEARASVAKHPIHPMLVVIPLGLWTAALALDVVAAVTTNTMWRTIAFWNGEMVYVERMGVVEPKGRREDRPRRVAKANPHVIGRTLRASARPSCTRPACS